MISCCSEDQTAWQRVKFQGSHTLTGTGSRAEVTAGSREVEADSGCFRESASVWDC